MVRSRCFDATGSCWWSPMRAGAGWWTLRHDLYGEVRRRFKAGHTNAVKSDNWRETGRSPYASRMPLRIEIDHRVARLILDDPARRNALDEALLGSLCDAIDMVRLRPEIGVLVLSGSGSAFCAGFDLARCADAPRAVEPLLRGLSACVRSMRELDIPVIARVQGAALAGGCALLTGCDFVVVARNAQLGYPTHRIGISPAVSIPSLVSRMGPAARAMLVANELVDGDAAQRIGLATHCVDADRLDAAVDALAASLCTKGPVAMRATKRWIREIEERGAGDLGRTPPRDGAAMERACDASLALAVGEEFATMLRDFWAARSKP
jgi:methylglutaconyl-CoA hydratase